MRVQPVDLSFAERATYALIHDADIAAEPAAVFEVLADHESWPERFGAGVRGEWVTSPPHGIGAVRTVQSGALYLVECFVAWEPATRFSFTVIEANLPFARAMLEDWRIAPLRQGSRVTYAIYYEPPVWLRPFAGAITRRIEREAVATLNNLKRWLERGSRLQAQQSGGIAPRQ
jgi:hypothetical protein